MGTLTSVIQLSTSGIATDRARFSTSKIANVKNPATQTGALSISTIATIATAPSGATASDGLYMYIHNTDATNFLVVTFGSTSTLKIGPGETSFFCVHDGIAVKGTASAGTVKIEYGTWTLSKY